MRVVTAGGDAFELGVVEAAPTIGITDYSRRVTDDYGVTTVVPRGFARRMSVKLGVPFDAVDDLQRRLAELRATPAQWIADERYASLSIRGFYKDFELDLATAPLSICTLTVEGLAEADDFVDAGGDPSADGASTLRMVDPVTITDAVLVASNVAENDAPVWSAAATYAKGARVVVRATHRIYESLVDANFGADPAGTAGKWLDVGPTGGWAMFDQALGTATIANHVVEVTVRPLTAVSAIAILDTNAATVRVTGTGYDRTIAVTSAGKALFLDLDLPAGSSITVALTPAGSIAADRRWDDGATWLDEDVWRDSLAAGDGTVTIGTMLVGAVKSLGVTEASPTAGIIDFSRKETDEFGEVTIVPRAWAKRMAAKALIRSDAVDLVAGRLAAVRARPVLWLGQQGLDSLTVYGFFKDFEIEIGEAVSKLSLSIEGLSTAAKIAPLAGSGSVDWPDVGDPTGTKPTDNADKTSDNTAKDTAAVGGRPSRDVVSAIDAAKARQDYLDSVTIPAVNDAVAAANAAIAAARAEADAAVTEANRKIALAQSGLDEALDELAAEVSRAQGAEEQLTQRIDTISASGGYDDTQVRALIQSVDTARADDKRAIGSRVDNVVTDYQRLDVATNTRITQTITAYSDADRAIGQRVDAIVTDYKALNSATNTRIGTEVSSLSDADRALGRRIDSIVATGGYDDRYVMSELSRIETASVTRDGALGQRVDTVSTSFQAAKGLTPNADFGAAGANWDSGGFTFPSYGSSRVASSQAGVYCQINSSYRTKIVDPNRGFRLHCTFRVFGAAQLIYVGLSMVDNAGTNIGNIYAPGYTTILQPGSYSVDQLYVGTFPETAVPQYRAGGSFIPGTNAVFPLFLANYPDAGGPFAGGYVQIESFWIEDVGTAQLTEAKVTQAATSAATANQAVADLSTSVTTRFGGVNQTLANYDQRITTLTTGAESFASRATALEAQASPSGGNLVPNTALSTLDGWVLSFNAGALSTMDLNGAGAPYQIGGVENNLTLHRTPAGAGLCNEAWSAPFAVRPGSTVQVYALTASHRCYAWVSLYFFNGAGAIVGYAGEHTAARINAGGQNINEWDITGAQEAAVPANAVSARMLLRAYDVSSDGYAWFSRPFVTEVKVGTKTWVPYSPGNDRPITVATAARIKTSEDVIADLPNRFASASRAVTLEAQMNRTSASPLNSYVDAVNGRIDAVNSGTVTTLSARIEDRATTIADAKAGAVAQTVQTLRSEYNGTAATVTQQAGTIAGLNGKTAAYVRVIADAGGGRAALSLWSDQFGGAWSLTGDGLIDGNLTVTGTITTRAIAPNAVTNTGTASIGESVYPIAAYTRNNPLTGVQLGIGVVTGGPVKLDLSFDGFTENGLYYGYVYRIVRIQNGQPVAISNWAEPPQGRLLDFYVDNPPAGYGIQYALQFATDYGGTYGNLHVNYQKIAAMEMKR